MLNFYKNIFRPRFKKYNTFKLGKSNADKILSFKKKMEESKSKIVKTFT